jgi:hypothetical protein
MQDYAQGILNAGLKQLPPGLEATSTVLEGDVAGTIVEAARGKTWACFLWGLAATVRCARLCSAAWPAHF